MSAQASTTREITAPAPIAGAIIAIDTAIGTSIAVGAGARIVEVSSANPRGHAEVIGTLIARALELAEVPAAGITGVVAGIGPGPFTGLRVGIAAAHAFATGRGAPLLPLHGHEAVAREAFADGRTAERVRVVQDAKRRELFVTAYGRPDRDGIPALLEAPSLLAHADYAETVDDVVPAGIPAARLVELAALRLAAGRGFEADRAVYLRQPDVAQPGAPKRVSR